MNKNFKRKSYLFEKLSEKQINHIKIVIITNIEMQIETIIMLYNFEIKQITKNM